MSGCRFRQSLSSSDAFVQSCQQDNDHTNIDIYFEEMTNNAYGLALNENELTETITNGFIECCSNGHLKNAQYLCSLRKGVFSLFNKYVDVNTKNNLAFKLASKNNHTNIIEWLFYLGTHQVDLGDNLIFDSACLNNAIDTTQWLWSLNIFVINIELFDKCFKN